MNPSQKGYVITTNVASLRNIKSDEVWLITRAGSDIPGTIRVRNLAPSKELFHRYITAWQKKHPNEWWHIYKEQFNQELKTEEKLIILRKLINLVKEGKVITLVCFCPDYKYCHRTLIANYLTETGITVFEHSENKEQSNIQTTYQQLSLF